MDYLWTPWRYQYMKEVTTGKQPECIFCDALARKNDAETLIVHRGAEAFVILNRYPYTSGHVMIVPYAHVADLHLCGAETLSEMMRLAQRVEKVLLENYKPDGRRRDRPFALARIAPLDGRFQFHDRRGRDARSRGRLGDYLRPLLESTCLICGAWPGAPEFRIRMSFS
jgi:ATP adenylyltransferase